MEDNKEENLNNNLPDNQDLASDPDIFGADTPASDMADLASDPDIFADSIDDNFKQTDGASLEENFEENKEITAEVQNSFNDNNIQNENTISNDLITVRPVKFQEFEQIEPIRVIKKNLDIMQDILLHVSVELGRTNSTIRDVMDMKKGSIFELNKIAGEQVEVFVNGKMVAKGEVIVIEDKFGVRITSTNLPKSEI